MAWTSTWTARVPVDPEVAWAWHWIVGSRGLARVDGLVADAGYADQSHLHRDVMAFTGATPATVAGEPFLAVDDIAWPSRATPAKPHVSTDLRHGRRPEVRRLPL
ncbi:hypothetical protein [Nonomuraea sp. bgisy101]|uniref:hypothetical protein n=1 Tax=Nonomuraea sp. bgisy101 TaxID=3413784 RepID=UPI003D74BF4E